MPCDDCSRSETCPPCVNEPQEPRGCIAHGGPDCVCDDAEAEPPPPQPERRPPYAVAYSVAGHPYEIALPGDATVRAVDGGLVITHSLGPVSGIVQARPLEGGAT